MTVALSMQSLVLNISHGRRTSDSEDEDEEDHDFPVVPDPRGSPNVFVPEPRGSQNVFDRDSAQEGFDLIGGNRQIARNDSPGHEYISLLAAPPRRAESDVIDPWSGGRDPWVRPLSSTFADRIRSAPTSTPTVNFREKFGTPA